VSKLFDKLNSVAKELAGVNLEGIAKNPCYELIIACHADLTPVFMGMKEFVSSLAEEEPENLYGGELGRIGPFILLATSDAIRRCKDREIAICRYEFDPCFYHAYDIDYINRSGTTCIRIRVKDYLPEETK